MVVVATGAVFRLRALDQIQIFSYGVFGHFIFVLPYLASYLVICGANGYSHDCSQVPLTMLGLFLLDSLFYGESLLFVFLYIHVLTT